MSLCQLGNLVAKTFEAELVSLAGLVAAAAQVTTSNTASIARGQFGKALV